MTTELLRQITEISKEIKNIHGDDYGEQYCNVAINLLNKNQSNINEYQILIEAAHSLIDSDYKDKLIFNLQKKVKEQDIRILNLEKDNKILKEDNAKKDIKINKLEKEIKVLKDDKEQFDALVKLNECNALVNKEFKRLYKIKFNKKRYDNNVPNIGDFIMNPPDPNEPLEVDDYNFWIEFNNKYPNSDNIDFRTIYQKIANDRSDYGAHVNVNKLSKKEFDNLIEIVYPNEYNLNKKTYEEYRDRLFMFPI
jgi:hypothetical protein